MKKFLSFFLAVSFLALTFQSKAQEPDTRSWSKTITSADTSAIMNLPGHITTVQYTLTKNSGTVAGKVYLDVTADNNGWITIDSLALSDVTAPQVLKHDFTRTNFLSVRWRNTNTTASEFIKYTYLRREDE